MARNSKTTASGNGSAQLGEARSQQDVGVQGVCAARQWMGTSLASLNGAVAWMEQVHALSDSTLSGWSKGLELCSRDLDQARDLGQVMALPAQMVNHQLEQTSRQFVKALQAFYEAQSTWAEDWRKQVAEQVQQAGTLAGEIASANGASQAAPPAAISQFQDQWLALTRRWIDAVGAASRAEATEH